jgi:hypothetical protein
MFERVPDVEMPAGGQHVHEIASTGETLPDVTTVELLHGNRLFRRPLPPDRAPRFHAGAAPSRGILLGQADSEARNLTSSPGAGQSALT